MSDEENRTLYVGNLDSKVTEELLYELFLQAGPVQYVKIPVDKSTKVQKPFGFVCFKEEVSVPYGFYLLDNIQLHGKNLRVQPRNRNKELPSVESVGIHTLDPEVNGQHEEYANMADNLPQKFNFNSNLIQNNLIYQTNNGLPLHNFATPMINQAEFSLSNNSLLGLPFPPPVLPLANQFNQVLGSTVDTNFLNNFKNMQDNSYHGNRNQHNQNYGDSYHSQYNSGSNYHNNRHDSYRDRSDSRGSDNGRQGYNGGDKSRFGGRLEYPNDSNNYNRHHNDRYDRDNGGSYDKRSSYNREKSGGYNRNSYDNRDNGGGDHNRRNSYDSRDYGGGSDKRTSYNNNKRNNYDDGSSSSTSRYQNSGYGNSRQYNQRY